MLRKSCRLGCLGSIGSAPLNETLLQRLYEKLLTGEVTATARFADEALPSLVRHLRYRCAALPSDMVSDAAIDAVLAIVTQPRNYDPSKGELWVYLRRIAENKAADQLRKWYRLVAHERSVDAIHEVADEFASKLNELPEAMLNESAYGGGLPREVTALIDSALQSHEERQVFALVCDGTRSVEEFAVVLGVKHLPLEERRREVKRVRDRIMRRLARRRTEIASLLAENV